jgi:hypothetical protein
MNEFGFFKAENKGKVMIGQGFHLHGKFAEVHR